MKNALAQAAWESVSTAQKMRAQVVVSKGNVVIARQVGMSGSRGADECEALLQFAFLLD